MAISAPSVIVTRLEQYKQDRTGRQKFQALRRIYLVAELCSEVAGALTEFDADLQPRAPVRCGATMMIHGGSRIRVGLVSVTCLLALAKSRIKIVRGINTVFRCKGKHLKRPRNVSSCIVLQVRGGEQYKNERRSQQTPKITDKGVTDGSEYNTAKIRNDILGFGSLTRISFRYSPCRSSKKTSSRIPKAHELGCYQRSIPTRAR